MPKSFNHNIIGLLLLLLGLSACWQDEPTKQLPFQSKSEYEQTMIASHKAFLQEEKEKIQQFIAQKNLEFQSTQTGLRYHIYESSQGDSLISGEVAVITYTLSSIEGDTLYASPTGGVQEFMVDYDHVESGLHEGIKQLKVGEKAILILPAHLGHGITGDQAAIPSQTTLVYDLQLLAKK